MTGPQHYIGTVAILFDQGMTATGIAEKMGVSLPTVYKYAKILRIIFRRKNAGPDERTEKMISMYQQGATLEKIGQQFKLTRERVRQLISKQGVSSSDGGLHKMAAFNRDKKAKQKEARYQLKYGLPIEVVQQLRKDGVLKSYRFQERNANNRGIEWKFDFATWFAIWQTSGKLHLRGRGKGHYVMSRFEDEGPYALGNVHIQLSTDNNREAVEKWRGKVKENHGVFLLYPGRDKAWCAKYSKKSLGFFRTEQEAVAARCAYMTANDKKEGYGLGRGLGYTVQKGVFIMQCTGVKRSCHPTAESARAAYLSAVAEIKARKSPDLAHLAPTESTVA